MAWLMCTHGNDKGFETELVKETYMLGRAPDCDIMILDERASRYHCKVSLRKKVFLLEDMGSTNGVKVKSKRIKGKKVKLKLGDSFAIGKTVFVLSKNRDISIEVTEGLVEDLGKKNRGAVVDRTYLEALSLEIQKGKKTGLWARIFGKKE
jgi:pSer/pThr/pTyr-binding forkhead associated (FHA) protein